MRSHRDDRGVALVLAIGVVALLALFGVSFVAIVGLEREAASNNLLQVRARLVADAGVESGLASLVHVARVPGREGGHSEGVFTNPRGAWRFRGFAHRGDTGNGIPLELSLALRPRAE